MTRAVLGVCPSFLAHGHFHVDFTEGRYSPEEAHGSLFAGNPDYAGKGSHVVVVRVPHGTELIRGTQPNELFTYGGVRGEILFNGPNPF